MMTTLRSYFENFSPVAGTILTAFCVLQICIGNAESYDEYIRGHQQSPRRDSSMNKGRPHAVQGQGQAPAFLPTGEDQNVTVVAGETAFLICRVDNLGDRTVTWRRQSEHHPLFIGLEPFSADWRLTVDRSETDRREWKLTIKEVRLEDAGIYRCQVTSKEWPARIYDVILNVKCIRVSGTEYVELGASIQLTCNVSVGLVLGSLPTGNGGGDRAPSIDADWYRIGGRVGGSHGETAAGEPLLAPIRSNERSGITVSKKLDMVRREPTASAGSAVGGGSQLLQYLVVTLTVEYSRAEHVGQYVCRSTNGQTEAISVYLINAGVRSAARLVDRQVSARGGGVESVFVVRRHSIVFIVSFVVLVVTRLLLVLQCRQRY